MRGLLNDVQDTDIILSSPWISNIQLLLLYSNYYYYKDMVLSKYFEPVLQEAKPKVL